MDKRVEEYDVVIIGGGAAGLTAGIYCGRARLKTLLIEKSLVGGLATYTNEIENYPGFPEGLSGTDLMNLFQKQAKRFDVKFKLTDVKSVDLSGEIKVVETFRINYHARTVIVASGGKPRLTGADNEDKYLYDKGISFCATCDAAANTGKTVMVIGSGDAAIEEGMFLSKFADKVIVSVIHGEGKMDCNEIAKAAALANPKMEFVWNTAVAAYEGNERLERVVLKNLVTDERIPYTVDSCFLFIGYIPNTEIFKGVLDMTPAGYLITNEHMRTNVSGVFAAGDVRDKSLRQVATAVGDGAIAGVEAERYIAEEKVFATQILNGGKPALVYVYNATDTTSRDTLPLLKDFETYCGSDLCVTVVDVYKSDGLAKRLGVQKTPCVAYVKDGVVQTMVEGPVTKELLTSLVK